MAKKTGPKHKLCRRLGECIWGSPRCPSIKRPVPPGQHGQNMRRKNSVYGTQLLEKQKIRTHYGLLERQMRNTFSKAQRMGGVTGTNLLALLETRLDCVIYRMGFANSIPAARQLVNHGHIMINGKKVDIPSYHVKTDSTVSIREKSRKVPMIADGAANPAHKAPEYIERNVNSFEGKVVATPNLETIPFKADTQAVIGFYSR
ncbi:MAG: 30S ribosomal protein S4 [Candidatus Hydrogenedentes bacterium]|nr:30S ribosomal protein S4 [Candidatus Hydrogenedentota bacterium]